MGLESIATVCIMYKEFLVPVGLHNPDGSVNFAFHCGDRKPLYLNLIH